MPKIEGKAAYDCTMDNALLCVDVVLPEGSTEERARLAVEIFKVMVVSESLDNLSASLGWLGASCNEGR